MWYQRLYPTESEFNRALSLNNFNEHNKYDGFRQSIQSSGIRTLKEVAMYLAQLLHESGGLKYTREISPDPSYGKYYGRGYIQLSDKRNYRAAGNELGYDYEGDPDMVERDPHAWLTSGWYWQTECSRHVSKGFRATTTNGIRPLTPNHENRERIYRNVCTAFGIQAHI